MSKKFIKTTAILSLSALAFSTPIVAFAADVNPLMNNDVISTEKELAPKITIYTTDGIEEYQTTNTETFRDFFDKHSIDSKKLKDLDGNSPHLNRKISKSEFFIKSTVNTKNTVITLKAPVKKVENDEMFEGSEVVKKEGKDGKALKTVFLASEPKEVNKDAENNADKVKTDSKKQEFMESKLTVLSAPVEKVIEVGTKPIPEETVIPPVVYKNAPANPKGNSIVETALKYVGYPYVWAANGPNAFDCSGLVQYVYGLHGIKLPRVSGDQGLAGTRISASEAKPGDLVVWGYSHIAIYLGDGKIVHAATPETGVVVGNLYGDYYFSRIIP